MRLLITFARAYPWRSLLTLVCLVLAGLVDGLSLSTLLSLVTVAVDVPTASGAGPVDGMGPARLVLQTMTQIGLEPTAALLLTLVVTGMAAKAGLLLLANAQVGYTVAHVATDLRLQLVRAVLGARWEYYSGKPVGTLSNAFATEAQRASSAYLFGASVAALIIQGVVYVAIAWLVSWQVTTLAILAGGLVVVAVGRLVRTARKAGRRQTRLLNVLLGRLTDVLVSLKPLKAMGREDLSEGLLRAHTRDLNRALRRQVISKEAMPALQDPMIASLIAIGLYVALVRFELELAGVLVIVFLIARVMGYFSKAQREYQKMATCDSAYWSIQSVIAEARHAAEPPLGSGPATLSNSIRLEQIEFAYQETPILNRIDLEIPARRMTAILGPSGTGKTTLIDLLTGLLRPQGGRLLVDGVPLDELDLRGWRRQIGYVPQEPLLLHDSVFHNVALGDPEIGVADVRAALRAAEALSFVEALPQGVETLVGERGGRLSGGQRQRIAIARALVRRPSLLLLDEPTSALDSKTAREIAETLQHLTADLTVVVISHTRSLARFAHRAYRLQDGVVVSEADTDAAISAGAG